MPGSLRELMLLRHAKSARQDESIEDLDRPLSGKGKKQALKLGQWILDKNLMPDLILVSPAVRTQQTLKRICKECAVNVVTLDELYLADVPTLEKILANTPVANRIMVIGHNPGLEAFYNKMVGESEDQVQLYPTGTLAHLIMPENWQLLSSGEARLQQFITPKMLKAHKKDT